MPKTLNSFIIDVLVSRCEKFAILHTIDIMGDLNKYRPDGTGGGVAFLGGDAPSLFTKKICMGYQISIELSNLR